MHDNESERRISKAKAKARARRALTELIEGMDGASDRDDEDALANLYQVAPDKLELVMEVCASLGGLVLRSPALDTTACAAIWRRVEAARDHLEAGVKVAPLGEQQRREAVLRLVERSVARVHAGRPPAGSALIRQLCEYEDHYCELETTFVNGTLKKTKPSEVVRKGGATNIAPALCAARLTVKAGAFGDRDEQASKKRFLAARRRARERTVT